MKHFVLSRYLLASACLMAAGVAGATPVTATAPKRLKPSTKELLITIGAAGQTGHVINDKTDDAKTLLKAGWLLTNETTRNGDELAVALSPAGVDKYNSVKPSENARGPREPQLKPTDFKVMPKRPLPEFKIKSREVRSVYPFDSLTEVGLSFFFPKPEDWPADKDFAQARSGTIAAANRKNKAAWEAEDPATRAEKPVAFKIENETVDGQDGATVWRVS